MSRVIVVTSGKGGVGKTTVTAGLGAALARENCRTVLIDADIGLNNLDVTLGVETKVVYDIADVIDGKCRVRQALIECAECPNLAVLPSSRGYEASKINGQSIKAIVQSLQSIYDFILIDCPAGIEIGFHRAVSAADEALIVTTPHLSALRDADKVLGLLRTYELRVNGLIVNRARGDLMLSHDTLTVEDIENLLKMPVVGVVPEDDEVTAASGIGRLPSVKSNVAQSLTLAAKSLIDHEIRLYDPTGRYKGLFGGMKRKLRRMI